MELTCQVLAVLPGIRLAGMPRMASFARVCAAVDKLLGTSALETYRAQELDLAVDVVEGKPFVAALCAWLDARAKQAGATRWSGTAGELLRALDAIRKEAKDARPPGWPTHAVGVAAQLRRTAPALLRRGVIVSEPVRTGHDRRRTWTITTTAAAAEVVDRPVVSAASPAPTSRPGLAPDPMICVLPPASAVPPPAPPSPASGFLDLARLRKAPCLLGASGLRSRRGRELEQR